MPSTIENLINHSVFDFSKSFKLLSVYSLVFGLALLTACGGGSSDSPVDEPELPTPDTTPPTIEILGDNPLEISYGSEFIDPGATATDDVDGNLNVTTSGSIDTGIVTSYSIEYSATDAAGNTTNVTRVVNVFAARLSNLNCTVPAETGGTPGDISIQASFPNLPFLGSPLAMVQPTNDSSFWFIALREGRIVTFENTDTVNQITEVLDISSKVSTIVEKGLTGLAVHPNYPQDNRIFAVYNDSSSSGRSTVSSYSVNTSTRVIDSASESVLISLEQPADNHNGGDIAFGADGFLYVSFGDGGANRDTSQQLYNLHGSVLRIDVSGQGYQIPNDNPFNNSQALCSSGERADGDTTECPEIYAYGFRNPWRFSFDSQTGELWVGDVGEGTFEEVDRVTSGGNYGWPIMEGNICFNNQSCDPSAYQLPITQYPRSVGVSTVGGFVYRGTRWPSIQGLYIWGDTFSTQFLSVPASSDVGADYTTIFNANRLIGSMAQGNDGELYFLNINGNPGDEILQLNVEDGEGGSIVFPDNLSDVGCFNTQTKQSEPGVFDYQLNAPLWSDGADKLRSFAIPDDQFINLLDDGDFDFPVNSVLLKHFLNGDTYLETRLLVKTDTNWLGYSYEWNDQQTDAVLLDEGKTKDVVDFVHTFPSANECIICHTSTANFSLGIESAQLNLERIDLGLNQLDFISQAGYLDTTVQSVNTEQLFALDDSSASIEDRARSYLHSNCSGCHREGSPIGNINLNYRTELAQTNTCDIQPSFGDLGIANARVISPGNADASVLVARMEHLGEFRMPPLASLIDDQSATSLIRDWINGMNGCD